jgi:RecA/RadA recombinase
LVAFTFHGTGAITATVQIYTAFPQTVDNATNIAAILDDTGTSGVVVASLAANSVTAAALAADAGAEIADAVLNRDMSTGTDSGSTTVRTMRQALRFLRNKWAVSAGTLTVYKEDDSTSSWTASVSSDAAAEPVIGSDPAGP